ncbi:hypothetical protein, partial [Escherichia coli]
MAGLGINTVIANVNAESIVPKILNREAVGTIILASKRKSSIKRWIAFSHRTSLPSIVINDNLITLLRNGNR